MPPKTKIFVGKLPNECSEIALRKLFERHGDVTECSVLGNFGFVHMKSEDQAQEAIKSLNHCQFQGSSISVEQSTGEKREGGGFRGGYRGGRGRGVGPMRLGGRGGLRPSPYDHPPLTDRYGGPPMSPMSDRYGPLPPPSRDGYYDDYDESLRRPLPLERRPLPPPRDPYLRDLYDRYDPYDRLPALPRSAALLERRSLIAPLPYDRRPDPYVDVYRERDPYGPRDPYAIRRSISPRRYAGPPRDMPPPPPRRF